jgi:hypothetical protein
MQPGRPQALVQFSSASLFRWPSQAFPSTSNSGSTFAFESPAPSPPTQSLLARPPTHRDYCVLLVDGARAGWPGGWCFRWHADLPRAPPASSQRPGGAVGGAATRSVARCSTPWTVGRRQKSKQAVATRLFGTAIASETLENLLPPIDSVRLLALKSGDFFHEIVAHYEAAPLLARRPENSASMTGNFRS